LSCIPSIEMKQYSPFITEILELEYFSNSEFEYDFNNPKNSISTGSSATIMIDMVFPYLFVNPRKLPVACGAKFENDSFILIKKPCLHQSIIQGQSFNDFDWKVTKKLNFTGKNNKTEEKLCNFFFDFSCVVIQRLSPKLTKYKEIHFFLMVI